MDEKDLIDERFACPACGERHIDRLEWIDDEQVRCHTCQVMYVPGGQQEDLN